MRFSIVAPCAAFRKTHVRLSHNSVNKLKDISYLSSVKRWEYAGGIEYDGFKFRDPSYDTSKKRGTIEAKDIDRLWNSKLTYHTHPGYVHCGYDVNENYPIFTTLPSESDLEMYIKGFPWLQTNIICDTHGYYVIDILKAFDDNIVPLPEAVNAYMRKLRQEPFMRIHAFSDEGYEYFHTTLSNWKRFINSEVHDDMLDNFGISIRYYGYNDEPPTVTFVKEI